MSNSPQHDWYMLAVASALSGIRISSLLSALGDPTTILGSSDTELAAAGVTDRQRTVLRAVPDALIQSIEDWCEQAGNSFVPITDSRYPPALATLTDPPAALFSSGDISLLQQPAIAIVGSRNPTSGGKENALRFSAELAANGLGIVSGMAAGIDAAAHRGALDADGATIAVLGTGIDVPYPRSNQSLFDEISRRGLVLSEYPPGRNARAWQFPARNRLISGLSLGTLVVEATERSGSLITARLAGEQGRSIFAIPGSIHNPLARGCHRLIRQGALLVESTGDVYEELGPKLSELGTPMPDSRPTARPADTSVSPGDDPDYQKLLESMGWDPIAADTLVDRSGLTTAEVSSMLLIMELRGDVTQAPGGRYLRNNTGQR